MSATSDTPWRLRHNSMYVQLMACIVVIILLLTIPVFLSWRPIYNALYDSYVMEKTNTTLDGKPNLDTKLEYDIKLLGIVVIGIGVVGFLLTSWSQRIENRKFAFQRVIENEMKLIEYSKDDPSLMKFFNSLDEKKQRAALPQAYAWYLAMALTIWQQVFAYRLNGWIDTKTWTYWDRHLREVHIGQEVCSTDPFVLSSPSDEVIRRNTHRYFRLWWQERQNYRYYHVDFVRYIDSILTDVANATKTQPFYS